MLWLGVFALAFAAEFASDALAVFYQDAARKLQRKRAVKWGVVLGALSYVDLAGFAAGMPLAALISGSVLGGAAGTWWSVGQNQIKARLRKAAKLKARQEAIP